MITLLSIILIPIQAALWRIGGASKDEIKFAAAWFRDILIPVLNFLYYSLTANLLIGILTGAATNSIRIGYGAYDPEHDDKPSWLAKITKDRAGWKIRGIYAAITSFSIGLFPTIYNIATTGGDFFFYFSLRFLAYIFLNIGIEIFMTAGPFKKNVWVVEPVIGASRALVFILCR